MLAALHKNPIFTEEVYVDCNNEDYEDVSVIGKNVWERIRPEPNVTTFELPLREKDISILLPNPVKNIHLKE